MTTEEQIRQSEEKFRLAFMTGLDACYIGTLDDGKIVEVNDNFYAVFGYKREECIGKTSLELGLYNNPDDRAKMVSALKTDGHVKDLELKGRRKNGDLITVSISANIWQMNNHPYILGVIRDVTHIKQEHEKLILSEERYHSLFDNSRDAILLTKPNGSILSANPAACKIFGRTEEEICRIGRNGILNQNDPRLQLALEERKRTGLLNVELTGIRNDGTIFPCEINSTVFIDNKGEERTAVILRDITEAKKAASEIAIQRKQMSLFIEHSPAALAMLDTDLRYLAVSRRWMTDYNLGEESIIGKLHYEVFPEIPQAWKDIHQHCLKGNIEKCEEDPFTRLDGSTDWIRWEIRPWHKETGEIGGIIMFTEVITERINAELKLKQSEERYHSLIADLRVGVVINSPNAEVLLCNQGACNLLGVTEDQILGKTSFDEDWKVIHEDGTPYPGPTHPVPVSIATRKPVLNEVMGVFRPVSNDFVWLLVNADPQLHEDGSVKEVITTFEDITQLKKAEEKIKESELRFRNLSENGLVGIYVLKDGKFSYVNPVLAKIFGYQPSELIGLSPLILTHPDYQALVTENTKKRLDGIVKEIQYECKCVCKNGDLKFIEVFGTHVILDSQTTLFGNIIDVTEREKTKIALQQSEERHRALIENISDTIILLNEKLEITYRSPSFARTSGLPDEIIFEKKVLEFIHPIDLPHCYQIIAKARTFPGVPFPIQFRVNHRKLKYIWVEGTISNLLQNESVQSFVVSYRDITERKKLEEQQMLMSSIVNSTDDAIISKTLDGILTSWNRGAEKILGYTAKEIVGQHISTIIPPDFIEEEHEIIAKVKMGKSVDHYETQRRKKNGEMIFVSLTVSPIKDANGNITGASKILRDISYRKNMELQQEKTIVELLQKNKNLEQFSHIVSHNLRAPVANIIGLIDMMKEISFTEEERNEILAGINTAAFNLDNVIKDMNAILNTKHQIGEKKENVVFTDLLEEIKTIFAHVLKNEKVQLLSNFEEINQMNTLKTYLYSIFYNLISNSIKYKRPDTKAVIEISSRMIGNKIVLIFKDNGLGIDLTRYKEDIFGLYKRFHLHIEGKGLGLLMVKTQVEALGGHISINSAVNVGTEFILEFENQEHQS